jgi:GDP-L-fucose synthase
MNVGLGYDYTINEYYNVAAQVIGWQGEFVHDLTKPTGMRRKLCSTKRLDAWGWRAPTSLEDGLRKTYAYYLESGETKCQ